MKTTSLIILFCLCRICCSRQLLKLVVNEQTQVDRVESYKIQLRICYEKLIIFTFLCIQWSNIERVHGFTIHGIRSQWHELLFEHIGAIIQIGDQNECNLHRYHDSIIGNQKGKIVQNVPEQFEEHFQGCQTVKHNLARCKYQDASNQHD